MSILNIQVIKPSNNIVLQFRNFKNESGRYMIEIYDQKCRRTVIHCDKVKTLVPSTLLARWVNYHLHAEMLQLARKGSGVEFRKPNGNVVWQFRDKVKYFGLHDVIGEDRKLKKVLIEDSIGMKNVVAIINAIGYNVETEFDNESKRVVKIVLKKE